MAGARYLHVTVMVWEGPVQVAVFTPPQSPLLLRQGRTAYPGVLQEHAAPSAAISRPPAHVSTYQVFPLQESADTGEPVRSA